MPAPLIKDSPIVLRLHQQRLTRSQFARPDEVVGWLGALQAQDYHGAKWAIGLRMRESSDGAVERAFNEGRILRTHVMRPTWHFVAPDDIRWLLELTAPRVNATSAYMHRQVGLDKASFSRANKVVGGALEGGHHLTRAELGSVLETAGIAAKGVRLAYVMMHAELDCVVCSGPRRGKQFTYALLDERSPSARSMKREEALAKLVLRYFTGHGPATMRDFVWWSGLTTAESRAGLEMVGDSSIAKEVVGGETYYWSAGAVPPRPSDYSREAFLLPTFDELLIGYSSFDESRRGGEGAGRRQLVFSSPVLLGGKVVGTWARSLKEGVATVRVAPFRRLLPSESEAVAAAADRYGRFIGMRAACTIGGIGRP